MLRHVYGMTPAETDLLDLDEYNRLCEWAIDHLKHIYGAGGR